MDNVSISKKFIGNTSWMMFSKIYSMAISLVVGSLSARYLGPSNYGLLSYGTSIISFFLTISILGFDGVFVAELVRAPEKERSYLGTALILRLIVSLSSLGIIYFILIFIEPGNKLLHMVTMFQALSIVFQSSEVLNYWFQAKLEMKYVTITGIVSLTVMGIWRISLLANSASIQWFALSLSISALVSGLAISFFFYSKANLRLKFVFADAKYLLRNSYHFIISGLSVTLYTQLDRIMLGRVVSSEAVGFFSAAVTIAIMWEFIPQAIINSARPLLMKQYAINYSVFMKQFKLLLLSISFMGGIVGIIFTAFGKITILILYGKDFLEATVALTILIWSTGFSMLGMARDIWLVSEGLNKYSKYFTLIGACTNVALNVLLIPIWGVTGAAITTLISQMVVAMFSPILFRQTRQYCKIFIASFRMFPELYDKLRKVLNR